MTQKFVGCMTASSGQGVVEVNSVAHTSSLLYVTRAYSSQCQNYVCKLCANTIILTTLSVWKNQAPSLSASSGSLCPSYN